MKTEQDLFFKAIFLNDTRAVESALDGGISPNEKHALSGTTPLQVACEAGSLGAAEVLLKAGADPNARFTSVSFVSGTREEDRVALMYARSRPMVDLLVKFGAAVDAVDKEGWSALSIAARESNLEVVQELAQRGASAALRGNLLARYGTLTGMLNERREHLEMLASKDSNVKLRDLLREHDKVTAVVAGSSTKT